MASALSEVAAVDSAGAPAVCPYELLEAAYERTVGAASGAPPGASTAVIVSLAAGALRWAYVGDSGFAVLRGGRIVRRSEPQRRSLNSPLRLSAVPGDSDGVAAVRTGQVGARSGDVVVVTTDGLFDNVRDEQLECAVQVGTTSSPESRTRHRDGLSWGSPTTSRSSSRSSSSPIRDPTRCASRLLPNISMQIFVLVKQNSSLIQKVQIEIDARGAKFLQKHTAEMTPKISKD
jgi:protein phosphatase PTC7